MDHGTRFYNFKRTAATLALACSFLLPMGCSNSTGPTGNSPSPSPVAGTPVGLSTSPSPTEKPPTDSPSPESSKTPGASKTPAPSKTPGDKTPGEKTPGDSPTPSESATPGKTSYLDPIPGVKAPALKKVVKVKMTTDLGPILIELYPEAAPNAAKRFEELVRAGFFDNTPIFRIVPGFVAQFGINSDPKQKPWKDKHFNDDPSLFMMGPGTLAFAKAGPNTNSTQVFINFADNTQALLPQNFTAFAKITQGMELTTKFRRLGDPSMGLSQEELWKDTKAYLNMLPEKPNMILKAEVQQ